MHLIITCFQAFAYQGLEEMVKVKVLGDKATIGEALQSLSSGQGDIGSDELHIRMLSIVKLSGFMNHFCVFQQTPVGPDEGGFHAPKMKGSQLKIKKWNMDQYIHLHPIMNLLLHFILSKWDFHVIFDY